MDRINLNNIELTEFVAKNDYNQHCKATFPLLGAHGAKDLATVYFELLPNKNLGKHTDSAEELIIVLEGEIAISLKDDVKYGTKGSLFLVPKMQVHDVQNIGSETAKVLGVFGGANNIIATFENEWLPTESNIVDTSSL